MKYTIEGFQQNVLVEYGLDCNDAVILRWILDFYHSDKMRKMQFDGRTYFWIFYQKVADDLPILGLKKRAIAKHIDKFVDCGLFIKLVDSHGGNMTYFSIDSSKYEPLVFQNNDTQQQGVSHEEHTLCSHHDIPYVPETTNIDSSIINSSINDEREKNPPKKRFSPPTLEDVKSHMKEKIPTDNRFEEEEAIKFMSHYESNGWMVGKNKMANWKSACTGWLNRMKNFDRGSASSNQQEPSTPRRRYLSAR